MSIVFSRPEPRGPAQRLVLLTLADIANTDGVCWPSIRYLSQRAAISERTIQYALHALAAAGWITIDLGGKCAVSGAKRASIYTLFKGAQPAPLTPSEGANGAPSKGAIRAGEGANGAPTRVQSVRERVQSVRPEGANGAPQPSGSVRNQNTEPPLPGQSAREREVNRSLPPAFDKPEFREWWGLWFDYLSELHPGRSIPNQTLDAHLRICFEHGMPGALEALRLAIEKRFPTPARFLNDPKKSSAGAAAKDTATYYDPENPPPGFVDTVAAGAHERPA